jgi:acetyltransferase
MMEVPVMIRPVARTDASGLIHFHQSLSERTVYFRYMGAMSLAARIARVSAEVVRAVEEPERGVWLVAQDPKTGAIVGYGELPRLPAPPDTAEIAITVSDAYQGRRIGTSLVAALLKAARERFIRHVTANILGENTPIRRLLKRFGFDLKRVEGGSEFAATLDLYSRDA